MDAIQHLNQHVDVLRLLKHYNFANIKPNGDTLRCSCAIHGGDNPTSFVISHETGLWYCWTGCGGGDVYTLIQHMEKCDFKTAVRFIGDFFNIDISKLSIAERRDEYVKEMDRWIKEVKRKRRNIIEQRYDPKVLLRDVTKFRDFKEETLAYFGLKFVDQIECEGNDDKCYTLYNRLLVPIHNEHGMQIGASLRATKSSDLPKWSHQPKNIKTSNLLYNYDRWVTDSSLIVVVEGIFDVWAYHEIGVPAVATFGAHLTDEQYRLLIKSGADIVLSYDGDDAGRIATSKAVEMLKNKSNLYHVELYGGQDPENIERNDLHASFERRKRL